MADTPSDISAARSRRSGGGAQTNREDQLEEQIARLQEDLKAVTATLARLSGEKVADVRESAKSEYRHLVRSGQAVAGDLTDQAGALEKQIKDTIREKPLTAVMGAVGIGFLLALMSRR